MFVALRPCRFDGKTGELTAADRVEMTRAHVNG